MVNIKFRIFDLFLMTVFNSSLLFAQFSPGPLSKYHAHLEGNSNCTQCHELKKKELSTGCVDCHTPLKEKIDANIGYHADKPDKCGECHSDHNGRAFELVYWPKDIKKFNHNETGYTLTGKHQKLECKKCHTSENIKEHSIINWASEHTDYDVLGRTFLGLEEACRSCHENIHEKQISNDCASCHNTSDWKLAMSEFDHNRARFLLTGKHKEVDCIKCHPSQPDHPQKAWKLTGMAFENCSNCHEDTFHKGTFGATCETCHTTVDWKKDLKVFDHAQTKYPLEGKHINVKCNECHQKKYAGIMPKYDRCDRCHEDKHFGQFANRKDKGECSSCHNVNGFIPSTYTFTMHQLARLQLDGSHVAVPCNKCHEPFQPKKGITTTRFTWNNYTCNICHSDVHRNQFYNRFQNNCETCHTTDIFTKAIFDHQKSAFPLDGRHQSVKCNDCHKSEKDQKGLFVRYSPVDHKCSDCHTFTEEIR